MQSWDKDIVCLPQSRRSSSCSTSGGFTYPRGQYRADLGRMGLIGKIHLSSDMDEEAVKYEISHLHICIAAGEGSKCLMRPSQSDNGQDSKYRVSLDKKERCTYLLGQMCLLWRSVCEGQYVYCVAFFLEQYIILCLIISRTLIISRMYLMRMYLIPFNE